MIGLLLATVVAILVVSGIWWLVKKAAHLVWLLVLWVLQIALYPFKMLFTALFRWAA